MNTAFPVVPDSSYLLHTFNLTVPTDSTSFGNYYMNHEFQLPWTYYSPPAADYSAFFPTPTSSPFTSSANTPLCPNRYPGEDNGKIGEILHKLWYYRNEEMEKCED
ncbi:unnamed protein product [Caenorhabditis sp. 36 PRJEB53466]|nr:unnamed protein product [Caenorhabditis sp. 36 PRJEB53466]